MPSCGPLWWRHSWSRARGLLKATLDRIPAEYPHYVTTGVCEYPRLLPERTAFTNGLECLQSEFPARGHSILTNPPSRPDDLLPRFVAIAP
jgi:hypothetical protein